MHALEETKITFKCNIRWYMVNVELGGGGGDGGGGDYGASVGKWTMTQARRTVLGIGIAGAWLPSDRKRWPYCNDAQKCT